MRYVMTCIGGPADGVKVPSSADMFYWVTDYQLDEDNRPIPTPKPPAGSAIYRADKVKHIFEFVGFVQ